MCDSQRGCMNKKKTEKAASQLEVNTEMSTLGNTTLEPRPRNENSRNRLSLINMFAAKKTVAQGMMDIALITANANQLRYLMEFCPKSKSYYTVFVLIIISLVLQVVVGIFLIFKGRHDLLGTKKTERAICINNFVILGVFLITLINVFISAFTMSDVSHNVKLENHT